MVSITHKRTSVAGKAPAPASLEIGELAINLADKKLYTKDVGGTVIELGGGGGGSLPDLSDTTVPAAKPTGGYPEGADGRGLLALDPSKGLADPDRFGVVRNNVAVGPVAPVDPHEGMIWVDTSGSALVFTWSTDRWIKAGDPYPKPGTFFADFTIEVDNPSTAVNASFGAGGHDNALSMIQWGDGARTAGVNGSHTYAQPGFYVIRVTIAGGTGAHMTGAVTISGTGVKLRKVGPFSAGTRINQYYWGTADTQEIDYTTG